MPLSLDAICYFIATLSIVFLLLSLAMLFISVAAAAAVFSMFFIYSFICYYFSYTH